IINLTVTVMGELCVHRNALFEDEGLTIDNFAMNNREGILAIARRTDREGEKVSEAVIEFWNVIGQPIFHLKTIPLGVDGAQSLLWIEDSDSLLAAHMDGSITVHHTHSPRFFKSQVCATPIWCLSAIATNSFCAGTDSGAVFFLNFVDDRLNVVRTINIGFGSRVLSLASDGVLLAVGSLDVINVIDAASTSIQRTLRLPRVEKRKPTVVWCLSFIEGILTSGDSRGCVCFWNPANGALVQTVQTHQADVLSLCVVRDVVYAGGVDPSIARLTHNKERNLWRVEHRRVLHNNDVRALVASRTALFSGGAEHHFVVSTKNSHHNALKLTPCKVASGANVFLYEYLNRIVMWRAAVAAEGASCKRRVALRKDPEKLLEIRSKNEEYIFSSAVSNDGCIVAVAKLNSVVVYSLDGLTNVKAPDVRVLDTLPIRASALVFCSHSLVVASDAFTLRVICVYDRSTSEAHCFTSGDDAGEVIRLHAGHDAPKVVVLTTRNDIYVADLKSKSLHRLCLDIGSVFMDVQFMNDTTLFVLCADHQRTVLEYSLSDNSLSGKAISKEALSMASDEFVVDMEAHPDGTILVGSKGTLRIIDTHQTVIFLYLCLMSSGNLNPKFCFRIETLKLENDFILCRLNFFCILRIPMKNTGSHYQ
uniref:Cirhin n=2 Tax=Parascaris univalens TaxID=6257 RepID=A0A915BQB7_PARUN